MITYAGTFITGFSSVVEDNLKSKINNCEILTVLDGLIIFRCSEDILNSRIPFLNNIYYVIDFKQTDSNTNYNFSLQNFAKKVNVNINELKKFIKKNSGNYAMTGYKVENTITENGNVKRGVCDSENDFVKKLIESEIEYSNGKYIARPLDGSASFEIEGDTIVSMNMFTFTPKIFDYLEKEFPKFLDNNITNLKSEFLIPDLVFKQCIEENIKVEVINTSAKWLGVTYKEDKENVVQSLKKLVDAGEYKKGLW